VSRGWIKILTLASVMVTSLPATAADSLPQDRTNPMLFSYFRHQMLELSVHQDARGGRRVNFDTQSLDLHAWALARDFVSQVNNKLDAVRQGFERAQLARSKALGAPRLIKPGVRAEWSASLKEVSDEAKHLHGMLKLVFDGVDPKGTSASEIDCRGLESGFEAETGLMGDQIQRLDRWIRDFLSGERFSISVEELRDEDMLMLLSRVQTEAKEMRRILDASGQLGAESSKRTGDCPGSGPNGLVLFPSRRIEPW
jgi:hypothetical protein